MRKKSLDRFFSFLLYCQAHGDKRHQFASCYTTFFFSVERGKKLNLSKHSWTPTDSFHDSSERKQQELSTALLMCVMVHRVFEIWNSIIMSFFVSYLPILAITVRFFFSHGTYIDERLTWWVVVFVVRHKNQMVRWMLTFCWNCWCFLKRIELVFQEF